MVRDVAEGRGLMVSRRVMFSRHASRAQRAPQQGQAQAGAGRMGGRFRRDWVFAELETAIHVL